MDPVHDITAAFGPDVIEKGSTAMRSSTIRTVTPIAAAVVLFAAIATLATGALAYGASASPPPSVTPTSAPTAAPTPAPTVTPIVAPTPAPTTTPTPPADGVFDVDLRNLTDHDVVARIDDETGSVLSATCGTPGDGMSVRWFDVKVENIDAQTLRVVWVGLGRDEVVHLGISRVEGKLRLRFTQDAPPPNSDAIGFDRVLNLKFVVPVRSEDVLTTVQESLDTAD